MNLITVTRENLEQEHICCAISNNKDCQVSAKKAWLADRFADGLVFKKGDVRGKCFIEYIPAEMAWCPIEADGYMYIDCLWVSGKFKGQGYSTRLLEACIRDSKEKGKHGLVILSSKKKIAYVADADFLQYKGFAVADRAEPYYQLMHLPFGADAPLPRFKDTVRVPKTDKQGFMLYYSHQCPFTAKYVPLIESAAEAEGIAFEAIRFDTREQAQNAPAASTAYSLFYHGEFLTHEILSVPKFKKILTEKGLVQ